MNEYDVKRLALVLAVQAEIEGMKIWNLKNPELAGYGQQDFDSLARELRELAYKHNEQL